MKKRVIVTSGLLLLFLPLIPAAAIRGILPLLFEFPLRTQHVVHAPYSPVVFTIFCVIFVVLLAILIFPRWFGFSSGDRAPELQNTDAFPRWGYLGIILCAVGWVCAWNRFEWIGRWQGFTFFVHWLGYILIVDGLVFKRTGTSILHRTPLKFVILFPASAIAWWYFEYINRFVQNWWYAGVDDYSALRYAVLATISFSTVLPAIFETRDLALTFKRFRTAYANGPTWFRPTQSQLWMVLNLGAGSLFLAGIFPSHLFFMTWASPLIILGAALALAGVDSPLTSMSRGEYTEFFALALAALMCGFFWEMWNFHSMPKWYYSVPYVMKWKLFEMPLPGYGGYLPFGPICALMWIAGKSVFTTENTEARRGS